MFMLHVDFREWIEVLRQRKRHCTVLFMDSADALHRLEEMERVRPALQDC